MAARANHGRGSGLYNKESAWSRHRVEAEYRREVRDLLGKVTRDPSLAEDLILPRSPKTQGWETW